MSHPRGGEDPELNYQLSHRFMKQISELLSKFKNLERPGANKDKLIEIIEKETTVELKKTDLVIQGKNIFIKLGGAAKTEILLKRQKILNKIVKELPNLKIDDIR